MEKYSMEPIQVVGWEGVFGMLVTLIGMGVLHGAVGQTEKGQGGYFDAREGFYEIFHNRAIAVTSLMIMVSIGYVGLTFLCLWTYADFCPQWFQFLRSQRHTQHFCDSPQYHRHLQNIVHLARIARAGLGVVQVATSPWVCIAGLWHRAVQRDCAATHCRLSAKEKAAGCGACG